MTDWTEIVLHLVMVKLFSELIIMLLVGA